MENGKAAEAEKPAHDARTTTFYDGTTPVSPDQPRNLEEGLTHWTGHTRKPSLLNPLGLPAPLTAKQKFYILVIQGLGAAVIDGLANFGIACAMYRTSNKPITVWKLDENTLAGDLGVTVFIQGIASFFIASGMVHVDLRRHKIDPFPCPWPDTSFGVWKVESAEEADTTHGRLWRIFNNKHGLGRGLHFFSGSDVNDVFDFKGVPFKELTHRWFWSIWKGSVLSAIYWFVFWPIAIAIVAPLYDNNPLNRYSWAPPIIKLIYGFSLGLAMNPVIACIALGSEDAIRLNLRDAQRARWDKANTDGPVMTEAEQVPRRYSQELEAKPSSNAEGLTAGGSRAASPIPRASLSQPTSVQEPLSVDVARLRSSLDQGSRRNSVELPRSPQSPAADSARRADSVRRGKERPLSVNLAHAQVNKALAAETSSPSSAVPAEGASSAVEQASAADSRTRTID